MRACVTMTVKIGRRHDGGPRALSTEGTGRNEFAGDAAGPIE
jgi:hypothetical protein